jgi:hypothetical protein
MELPIIIIDPCYVTPTGLFSSVSTTCNINNGSSISCVLFKAVNDNKTQKVRLYTDGYTPNEDGFPADATIEIKPQVPFEFQYSSDEPSTMSFLAISLDDKEAAVDSPITLTCIPA